MSAFEPAFLAVGGTIGGVLGLFTHAPIATFSDFWSLTAWIGPGIGSFIGIYLAGFIKLPRLMDRRAVLIRASIVPITLIVFLCLLNYYPGFPGADATAQVRQQWASKTFNNYDYMIGDLKRCEPIIEKIGNVNFVAPTIGKNVSYLDGGSGYHGEFTLEAVRDFWQRRCPFSHAHGQHRTPRLELYPRGDNREIDLPPLTPNPSFVRY